MTRHIAIVHVKTRNEAISIGALCIKKELDQNGYTVDICTYATAHQYSVVMVSMTSTWDIYDCYKQMKRAKWQERKFIAIVGGFGCQNPFALAPFVDYAFFGRAENIIATLTEQLLKRESIDYPFITSLQEPTTVIARPVQQLYESPIKYGKNNSTWVEEFTGCPYKCKFCHYTHNRKNVRKGNKNQYINEGISTGSKEIMLKDIANYTEKLGRVTAALDGFSERLRYLFGKRISWDDVEEALDHLASFKGNTYFKMYNITNFPTETEEDEQEFVSFFQEYTQYTSKKDGLLKVDVFNTAFRPSLNTPMERMPVRLFPEARREDNLIAKGDGVIIKYTNMVQGAYMHLADIIAIRYTPQDHKLIDFMATNSQFNKLNHKDKLQYLITHHDITPFIRSYSWDEPFITDKVRIESSDRIKKQGENLHKKNSHLLQL